MKPPAVRDAALVDDTGADERMNRETQRIRRVYAGYDSDPSAQARWSKKNPGFRRFTAEAARAVVDAIGYHSGEPLQTLRILEVGCGIGDLLGFLVENGARPQNLFGIDLLPERISACRQQYRDIPAGVANLTALPFLDATFDFVVQMTVFSSILDKEFARLAAAEIDRVLVPGGAVVWWDLRYPSPGNRQVRAVRKRDIRTYFPSYAVRLRSLTVAAPLARRLGRHTQPVYRVLEQFPPLRSHWFGLLVKPR